MSPKKPCEWEGVKYPSIAAAARALGISKPGMSQRLSRRTTKLRLHVPTTIDGVTYPSRREASRRTGILYDKLR